MRTLSLVIAAALSAGCYASDQAVDGVHLVTLDFGFADDAIDVCDRWGARAGFAHEVAADCEPLYPATAVLCPALDGHADQDGATFDGDAYGRIVCVLPSEPQD